MKPVAVLDVDPVSAPEEELAPSDNSLASYKPVSGRGISELTSIISHIHYVDSSCKPDLHPPAPVSSMAPLISIITPCYNQAEFLTEAASSLLEQTYVNWEWLIVRDGGLETCLHEAKKLQATYSDRVIRVFDKLNGGLADTRNFAIARANGDWICLLDADDSIHFRYLELAVKTIQSDPRITAVNSDQQFFQESSWRWDLPAFSKQRMRYEGLFPVQTIFRYKAVNIILTCNRKWDWARINGFETTIPWFGL